jgi:hypothetical protein
LGATDVRCGAVLFGVLFRNAGSRRITMNQQAGAKSAVSKAKGRGDTIFIATPRAGEQRGRG